jgi:hypothetical protein
MAALRQGRVVIKREGQRKSGKQWRKCGKNWREKYVSSSVPIKVIDAAASVDPPGSGIIEILHLKVQQGPAGNYSHLQSQEIPVIHPKCRPAVAAGHGHGL